MTTDFRNLIGRGAFAGEGVSQLRPTSIPVASPPPALVQAQLRRALEQEMGMLRQSQIIAGNLAAQRAATQQRVADEQARQARPSFTLEGSPVPPTVTPTSPPNFPSLPNQPFDLGSFLGNVAGSIGRGALGAGRFVEENNPFSTPPGFQGAGALVEDPQGGRTELGTVLDAGDAVGIAGGAVLTEGITRALDPTLQNLGITGTSFQDFVNDASARRQGAGLEELLTLQNTREAFQESDINPAIRLGAEIIGDPTNLIPGAALARPFRVGSRIARTADAATNAIPPVSVATPSLPAISRPDVGALTRQIQEALPVGTASALGPEEIPESLRRLELTPERITELNTARKQAAEKITQGMQAAGEVADTPQIGIRAREEMAEQILQRNDDVKRITDDIAKQIRETPTLTRAERADVITQGRQRQRAVADEILDRVQNDPNSTQDQINQAFRNARAAQVGEITPRFEPPTVSVEDVGTLQRHILDTTKGFDRQNTEEALFRLLEGVDLPKGELDRLQRVFGDDLVESFVSKVEEADGRGRIAALIRDAIGVPSTIVSAIDHSFPLRQTLPLVGGNPVKVTKSFANSLKAIDARRAYDMNVEITAHPHNEVMRNVGGMFVQPVRAKNADGVWEVAGPASLTAREESFLSRWAEKLPGVGVSSRLAGTYLNKLKHDISSAQLRKWQLEGALPSGSLLEADLTVEQVDRIRNLGKFMNWFTGRGPWLTPNEATEVMAAFWWSPRLLTSRVAAPFLLNSSDPTIRKLAAKNLAATFGSITTILAVMSQTDLARVELDPRSSDFGKMRLKRQDGSLSNVSLDPWGGFQQVARYLTQFITNTRKGTEPDEAGEFTITPGEGALFTSEEESGSPFAPERIDTLTRFALSKRRPGLISLAVDELVGRSFIGDDLDEPPDRGRPAESVGEFLRGETGNLNLELQDERLPNLRNPLNLRTTREQNAALQVFPLFVQDLIDAIEDEGLIAGTGLSIPTLLGTGVTRRNEPLPEGELRRRAGDEVPEGSTGETRTITDVNGNKVEQEILTEEAVLQLYSEQYPGETREQLIERIQDETFQSLNSDGSISNRHVFPRSVAPWAYDPTPTPGAPEQPEPVEESPLFPDLQVQPDPREEVFPDAPESTPQPTATSQVVPTPFIPSAQPTPGSPIQPTAVPPTATPTSLPVPSPGPGLPVVPPTSVPQPTPTRVPGTTGQTWEYVDAEGNTGQYHVYEQDYLLEQAREANPQATDAGLFRILRDARYPSLKEDGTTAMRHLYPWTQEESFYSWLRNPPLPEGATAFEDRILGDGTERTITVWNEEITLQQASEEFGLPIGEELLEAMRKATYESWDEKAGKVRNRQRFPKRLYPWLRP